MPKPPKGVVLVADREATVRDVLHFYLKRSGYQVIQVDDGQDALLEMSKVQPDLILADLSLPEIRGDQLCKMVKKNPETKDIFFMLMTPPTDILDIDTTIDALSIGADDSITKPLRSQELLARVGSAFRIIAMQKEIKQQNRELISYRENVQRDMELAARLQASLLPEPGNVGPYRYTHRYQPFAGLGGDIYAIANLPYGGVALLIADVSGHGVTAALISAIVKTSFENQIRSRGGPLTWAQGMSRDLARNTLEEQYATAILAKLDPMENTLTYVCAGHDPPIFISGGSSDKPQNPAVLHGASHPLGMIESMAFSEHTVPFVPKDRLVLYTDGLVEAESASQASLGIEGLLKYCSKLPPTLEDATGYLFQKARKQISDKDFSDDVTLVVIDHLAES
jgi:serine phosphatase RsbU (regulator of sigma subunit)